MERVQERIGGLTMTEWDALYRLEEVTDQAERLAKAAGLSVAAWLGRMSAEERKRWAGVEELATIRYRVEREAQDRLAQYHTTAPGPSVLEPLPPPLPLESLSIAEVTHDPSPVPAAADPEKERQQLLDNKLRLDALRGEAQERTSTQRLQQAVGSRSRF